MPETLAAMDRRARCHWPEQNKTVLRVVGELTRGAPSAVFSSDVKDLLALGVKEVAIDARLTGYIDSYGLGVIVRVAKECRESGASFAMVGLSDDLTTLFKLLKLDSVIQVWTESEWLARGGFLC